MKTTRNDATIQERNVLAALIFYCTRPIRGSSGLADGICGNASGHQRTAQHLALDIGVVARAAIRGQTRIAREARARGHTRAAARHVNAEWRRCRTSRHAGETRGVGHGWTIRIELRTAFRSRRTNRICVQRREITLLSKHLAARGHHTKLLWPASRIATGPRGHRRSRGTARRRRPSCARRRPMHGDVRRTRRDCKRCQEVRHAKE